MFENAKGLSVKLGVDMVSNKSVDEIKRLLKKYEREMEEKYGVRKIGVFGSYVRGDQKKGSDIDILVEFYHKQKWI